MTTAMIDYAGTVSETTRSAPVQQQEVADWDERKSLHRQLTGQENDRLLKSTQQTERLKDGEGKERSVVSSTLTATPISLRRDLPAPLQWQVRLAAPLVHPDAQRILRTHFVEQILTDLRRIQQHCGTPTAAVYGDSLLRTMRTMSDHSPYDPYLGVVMALHDALAFCNNWLNYSADQYEGAYRVLKDLVQQQRLDNSRVEKAIMELEELGFNTTPFEVDIDFVDDIDDEE